MKKEKILLISFIYLFHLSNCIGNELIKDSSYINNQGSSYGIYEVKFPSDKTIEIYSKGKYFFSSDKRTYRKEKLEFNKKNNNFFIYDEYGDVSNMGFFSSDMLNLYMANEFDGINILERVDNGDNTNSILGQTYYAHYSYGYYEKININIDGIIEEKSWSDDKNEPEEWTVKGKIELDESKSNFIIRYSYDDNFKYTENGKYKSIQGIGIFSEDKKKMYFYDNTGGYLFTNNKIFVNSFEIDNLTFETILTDFQILYPQAEFSQKGISKDSGEVERHYTISDFTDLGYFKSEYIFYGEKLKYITKYMEDKEATNNIQNSLKELTNKFGKPKVVEYFDTDPYTTIYVWNGEVVITYIYTRPYNGYDAKLIIIFQTKKDEKENLYNY